VNEPTHDKRVQWFLLVRDLDDLLRRFDKELWARKASPPEVQYLARQWKLPQPDYKQIEDAAKRTYAAGT
jgi:mannosyltransferase OCH1-like enzyme